MEPLSSFAYRPFVLLSLLTVLQNVADDENTGLLKLGNLGLNSSSDIAWLSNFGWFCHLPSRSPGVFISKMGMVNPDSTVVPIKEHNTSEVTAKY